MRVGAFPALRLGALEGSSVRRLGPLGTSALRLGALGLVALFAACPAAAPPLPAPEAPAPASPSGAEPDPAPTGRLGDAALPRRIAIDLAVDPRNPRFSGSAAIDLEMTRPVTALWLHARELTIERAALVVGSRSLPLTQLSSPDPDLLGLAVGQKIGPGPARLIIQYGGKLGTENALFRQQVEGTWYAFTDFEPTDARMTVPCFDDPRFKVPWQVTLRVPERMLAFANAPEVRSSPAGRGWRRVEFADTPPLPSYLLAFAVGPFDVLDGAKQPVPMRVIATRGRARMGAEALAVAPPMLAEMERYIGSRTPFAKVDFVAVPKLNGAMENPGLITFADGILLVDPVDRGTAAWRERQRLMAGVMAHELAHLWFGDLVTMRWWDELWLNEGLATFLSDRLMAVSSPADAGLILDVADKRLGLDLDRGGVQAPVRRAIRRPPDINDQFSALIYRKGGAIVSMLEAYIGEERMRDGLRRYVAGSAGGSVTTAELTAALSASAGRDLRPILSSFLDQPGVPLVEAALECGSQPTVSLRQSRYTALPAAPAAGRWSIPVCVAWEGGAAPVCTLLDGETGSLRLPADRCPAWIHPNPGERGYYVYSLPSAQLRALASAPLTAREQAGLADDIAALLAAGRAPLDGALDAAWALARSPDPTTALRTSQILALVSRALLTPPQRRAFAARLRAAYGPLARRLGVSPERGDSALLGELRGAVVALVGRDGDDRVLQREALDRLSPWVEAPASKRGAPSNAELDLLYLLAPLAGGEALFERALANGRGRAARTLAGFRQPALVERALSAIDAGRLGPAESLDILAAFLRDGATQDLALPVALDEYAGLAGRLADTDRARSASIFGGVCRADARASVEEELQRVAGGELASVARATLDAIDACVAFRQHYLPAAGRLR